MSIIKSMQSEDSEKLAMACLLRNPELIESTLPLLEQNKFFLDGNNWIANKIGSHFSLHKQPPSFNILNDYACSDVGTNSNPVIQSARQLLMEYQTYSDSDINYFKDRVKKEISDSTIKSVILEKCKTSDWITIKETIEKVTQANTLLPKLYNMDEFKTKPATDKHNLLNDWALEREGMIAIVAPTGIGKSVLTTQLACAFACGKETLGFKPNGAFKVLVIQSEDSDNDVARMLNGATLNLTPEELQKAKSNVRIGRVRNCFGEKFLRTLDAVCAELKPDIVFVNPLLKYFGEDPMNTREVAKFLNELEGILEKHQCGLILVHHTVKQSKQSRMNQVDSSYAGFGSSAWSNSVRDTIEIRPAKEDGYYRLLTAKRSSQFGWREKFVTRYHDYSKPHWIEVPADEIEELSQKEKSTKPAVDFKNDILFFLPPSPQKKSIKDLQEDTGKSEKTLRKYLMLLLKENRVIESFEEEEGKRGHPTKLYSKNINHKN